MRLLELRHVDRDDVLLAAVERLGERERGLGLADARRAAQHEDADRLVRIVEPGAVGLDALGDHLEAVALADDAPVEDLGEMQHRLDLVGDHLADRNAGPVGDDRGDRLLVDMGVDHALLGIDLAEFADLGAQRLAVGAGVRRPARRRAAARLCGCSCGGRLCGFGASLAMSRRREDLLDERALACPSRPSSAASASRFSASFAVDLGDALLVGGAEVALARERRLLAFERRRSRPPRPRSRRAWRSG